MITIDDIAIAKYILLSRSCNNCKHVELIDVSEYTDNHNIISMCGLTMGVTGQICSSYEVRNVH